MATGMKGCHAMQGPALTQETRNLGQFLTLAGSLFPLRQVISGPGSPLHSEGRTFTALPITCDKSELVT